MKFLFHNGVLGSLDQTTDPSDSLLVVDGVIADIGSYHKLKLSTDSKTEYINLEGKMLLPGLTDNHTHIGQWLKIKTGVSLENARSCNDIQQLLQDFIRKQTTSELEKQRWIAGYGLHKHLIKDYQNLDRKFLDHLPIQQPFAITTFDFHTKIVNSKALDVADITATTNDPEGGRIGRDSHGKPNGILYEKACNLISDVMPSATEIFLDSARLSSALQQLYTNGITSLHSMERFLDYQRVKDLLIGKLRVCWHIYHEDVDELIKNQITSYQGCQFSKFGTVKLFLDGSLGSETAFLSRPYNNNPENRGFPILEQGQLTEILSILFSNGLAVSVHTIGDSSTDLFLSSFEELKLKTDIAIPVGNRLEHLQFLNHSQIERISQHDLYCSMQPIHLSFDIPVIKKLCHPDLIKLAYPFSTMLQNRCRIGFGSDAPIADINPFLGVYYAVTRHYEDSVNYKGWTLGESICVDDALLAYTLRGAEGSLSSHYRGSLELGKRADLIVIKNYADKPSDYWREAKSYFTMIDGLVVHNQL